MIAGNGFFIVVGGALIISGYTRNDAGAMWLGFIVVALTAVMMIMDHRDKRERTKEAVAVPASAYRLACAVCGHIAPSPEAETAYRQMSTHLEQKHGVPNVDQGH